MNSYETIRHRGVENSQSCNVVCWSHEMGNPCKNRKKMNPYKKGIKWQAPCSSQCFSSKSNLLDRRFFFLLLVFRWKWSLKNGGIEIGGKPGTWPGGRYVPQRWGQETSILWTIKRQYHRFRQLYNYEFSFWILPNINWFNPLNLVCFSKFWRVGKEIHMKGQRGFSYFDNT